MVDINAAIGYVVAHGDPVDRARLSHLRTGATPPAHVLDRAELGQAPDGGWPATSTSDVASIDATCFRLAELDDLGALRRPPARRALDWLSGRQRPDGTWQEDEALAGEAPPWARPGDPEAGLYLTARAGFWLAVGDRADAARAPGGVYAGGRPGYGTGAGGGPGSGTANGDGRGYGDRPGYGAGNGDGPAYAGGTRAAAEAVAGRLRADGTWPSYLATGWWAAALLHHEALFYESARIRLVLADRLPRMSPADVAALLCALRYVAVPADDWLLAAARQRLAVTQRSDGGWPSDDGPTFDVHTTLTAIRACR